MAANLLATYKNALLTDKANCPNFSTDDIKCVLVTSNHVADLSATGDEFLSGIPAAERVMTSASIPCTVSGTNVNAQDGITLTDPDNGKTSSQAFLYLDTGTETTSRLLMHDDSVALTSDGTNDTLNDDAQGLFDL